MTTKKTTLISEELKELIDEAAKSFKNFIKLWSIIKEKGIEEGHTEDELQGIVSSQIRQALPADLTPQQVKKKIWYVFHSEEHKARTNANRAAQSTGGTNIRTNEATKDIEESDIEKDNENLKDVIAQQEEELRQLRSKPTEKYEDNAKELFEETLKDRDNTITELRTELVQKRVENVKPDEEPDDYLKNLEIENAELKKYADITLGPFLYCQPGSNVYNDSKNLWKELLKAVHYVGYDLVIYEKQNKETGHMEVVPPKARGFNFGIVNGKFDGVFGVIARK